LEGAGFRFDFDPGRRPDFMKMTKKSEIELLREALVLPENRCFGGETEIVHDLRDEYLDPEEMPLFATIRSGLPKLVQMMEQRIREHQGPVKFWPALLGESKMVFEDIELREHPDDWTFKVYRADWPDFEYCFDFRGVSLQQFMCGD
jgi:hypothetical protein